MLKKLVLSLMILIFLTGCASNPPPPTLQTGVVRCIHIQAQVDLTKDEKDKTIINIFANDMSGQLEPFGLIAQRGRNLFINLNGQESAITNDGFSTTDQLGTEYNVVISGNQIFVYYLYNTSIPILEFHPATGVEGTIVIDSTMCN